MARITIIVSDTFCSVDGVGYNGVDMSSVSPEVHAVQWFDSEGWIEFNTTLSGKPENQTITSLDAFQQVLASWDALDYEQKNPPPPLPPTAEQNKQVAAQILSSTDWTQIPSTSDPAQSNPYLTNADAFAAYRSTIRDIAINPVAGNINWPVPPTSVWST